MKKLMLSTVCAAFLLSSCDTYTGTGAYAGGTLGSILGSAIGGISGGPRGSDVGTIVGMAGGAIIGGAIGAKADEKRQDDLYQYRRDKEERAYERRQRQHDRQEEQVYETDAGEEELNSGFDASNSGDDRLYDFNGTDYTGNYTAQTPTVTMPATSSVENLANGLHYSPAIEIRNARFVDDNQDNVISRGELCKIIFEVMNRGKEVLYDVQPTVIEATGNKHIYISPGVHVEKIMPGAGIRYTALVKADNRLKNGKAKFCVSVVQGTKSISKVSEFNIPTRK
ncbi:MULTISPECIES: hypothetical protein [Prevotellaceae]|uniref:hypothetical protein n=1 Tax=Prevotellaceae TaxID=171552 RepID=UPI0003D2BC9A|nr:hypothetical protein [Prevotella phocaeensis]ETD16467.1 hypothetical protein HMPREF1199_02135 [Hoylesella oralis CC98A]